MDKQTYKCHAFFFLFISLLFFKKIEAAFIRAQIDALTTFTNLYFSMIARKENIWGTSRRVNYVT